MSERKYQDGDIRLWGNVEPVCPHCGHEQETTEIHVHFDEFDDEEIGEMECDSCEEEFYLQLRISHEFTTYVDEL
jgi:transcription elongation factor Elf1